MSEQASNVITLGIDELQKALNYGLKFGEATGKIYDDDKFHAFTDLPHLFTAATALGGYATINFNLAWAQAGDVDPEERKRLGEYVRANFTLSHGNMEEIVEEAIDLAIDFILLTRRSINLCKKIRRK
jgi:hypothetical protein